jgi:hypothetical protein
MEAVMKTISELLPLAIGIAVIGGATWVMLDRDIGLGRWLLAALLFAHGWVHLMFVFPQPAPSPATAGAMAWPFDLTRSWLVTDLGLGVELVRTVGIVVMAAVFAALVLATLSTIGMVIPAGWWAGLVVVGAVGSTILLVIAFSPALILGFGINLALLWFVLASGWNPAGTGAPGGLG